MVGVKNIYNIRAGLFNNAICHRIFLNAFFPTTLNNIKYFFQLTEITLYAY